MTQAQAQMAELELKAREWLAMLATLEHRMQCCHADDRSECPILEPLARIGLPAVPVRRKDARLAPRGCPELRAG